MTHYKTATFESLLAQVAHFWIIGPLDPDLARPASSLGPEEHQRWVTELLLFWTQISQNHAIF